MRTSIRVMKYIKFATISFFSIFAAQLQAEGIFHFGAGLNQPLRSTTTVFIHVPEDGDLIRVHLCDEANQNTAVAAEVFGTTLTDDQYTIGSSLASLSSPEGNISCGDPMTTALPRVTASGNTMEFEAPSAGVYALTFADDTDILYGRWDFSVVSGSTPDAAVDATEDAGNIFSYRWSFRAGSFLKADAVTGQMYILVPGGYPDSNYVWVLDLQEFSGFGYEVVANDLGLDAPFSGISAPNTPPNNVTPKYPVYLNFPVGADPDPAPVRFPALTDTLVFVDDGGNDATISPDGDAIEDSGNFQFTPDADGTYAITIDVNRDGIFGANDRFLLGRMSANVLSSVNWDGTDASGATVPNASYPVQLELRVGEYHFIAGDAETSGGGTNDDGAVSEGGSGEDDGLTILQATDATTVVGTRVYWDDATLLTGDSNLPNGVLSSAALTGDHRHTWGSFINDGLGNNAFIDTHVYGNSTQLTASATVAALNTPPTIGNAIFGIDENSPVTTSVGTPVASDVEGDVLTYTITAGNTDDVFAISALTGEITVNGVLDTETTAQYTLTVQVSDQVSTDTATITIDVNDVNDAPVATDQSIDVVEDIARAIVLSGTDADLDTLTYTVVTGPANGSLSGTAPNLSYTPSEDYSGPDSFTFRVNDGSLDSNVATISLTVGAANDAPVADSQSVPVVEDTATGVSLSASDGDLDTLGYTVVTGPTNGSLSGTAPNLIYTPNEDYVGADSFTFIANDGSVDSNIATISLSISAVNDAPVANAQLVSVVEGSATAVTLTGSDVDLDTLTYTPVTGPTNGLLAGTGANLTYTPNADFTGSDEFTFIVNDGSVDSALATISINVLEDLDEDGIPDTTDPDDDNDGIPDTTEGTADPDEDGVPNDKDTDADGDGILDEEEGDLDTDGDGTANYLDEDSDGDGIPDAEEGTSDTDGDGTADYLDDSMDEDGDGIPDIVEGTGDTDGDGIADYLDPDSDNDGLPDSVEAGIVGEDTDGDGIDDVFDVDETGGTDANGDGIDDGVEPLDTDDDGTPDYVDIDSDDDGIPDAIESTLREEDTDTDGIPDAVDVDQTGGADTDLDGIDDAFDASITGGLDANLDGIDDLLAPLSDRDGDGQADFRDLDSDDDGISDAAESGISGDDADNDGIDDRYDIDLTGGIDANGDGIDDGGTVVDTDGDGVPDMHDLDSDNDSLFDTVEAGVQDGDENALADNDGPLVETPIDTDNDGIADFRDVDSDNDGTNDIEGTDNLPLDTNGDGVIDVTTDLDGDGIDDVQDTAPAFHGMLSNDRDQDDDGIADISEGRLNTDGDSRDNYLDRDSDNDGLSDAFETDRPAPLGMDSDGDGIDDRYDADATGGSDADNNGVDDIFIEVDTDEDGDADYLDTDSDNDGISDSVEQVLVPLSGNDTDNDGIDDAVDVDVSGGSDVDGDGIDDDTRNQNDVDGDGIANFRDLDSDGDGIPDSVEGSGDSDGDDLPDFLDTDSDGDQIPDNVESTVDTDNDGVANYLDSDTDGDGLPDSEEGTVDSDNDGLANYLDLDSDDDGVPDGDEGTVDSDSDGIADFIDSDSDNDGLADGNENGDFNNDGINDRIQNSGLIETGLSGAGTSGITTLMAMLGLLLMRRKKHLASVFLLMMSAIALKGHANEPCKVSEAFSKGRCWYLGAGIGMSQLQPAPRLTSWRISDDEDIAFKVLAGFPFTDHLFTELVYEDMGAATLDNLNPFFTESLEIDYTALGASVGYLLKDQKARWNAYVKAGLSFMDTEEGQYVEQDYGTQMTLGLGVKWRFSENWFVRLDATSYDEDAQVIGLTLAKYFGGTSKREKPAAPVVVEAEKVPYVNTDLDEDGVLNENDNCPNTEAGTTVNAKGCPLLEAITLNIQFDSSRSFVKNQYMQELTAVSEKIKEYGDVTVSIEGHTDSSGKSVANQALSEARAAAVAKILKQKTGLGDDSFETIGHGELQPIADNSTVEGRYQNRRVVVIISRRE